MCVTISGLTPSVAKSWIIFSAYSSFSFDGFVSSKRIIKRPASAYVLGCESVSVSVFVCVRVCVRGGGGHVYVCECVSVSVSVCVLLCYCVC